MTTTRASNKRNLCSQFRGPDTRSRGAAFCGRREKPFPAAPREGPAWPEALRSQRRRLGAHSGQEAQEKEGPVTVSGELEGCHVPGGEDLL